MKYIYAYKTSDGTRHQSSMNADSREEVFISLRARGIKAIKVVAADGSKANGEIRGVRKRVVFGSAVAAAIVAAVSVYFAFTIGVAETATSPYTAKEKASYLNLNSVVEKIVKSLINDPADEEINQLLSNGIHNLSISTLPAYVLVEKRASSIVEGRKKVRHEFAVTLEKFKKNSPVMKDVQRLYGVLMTQFDVLEIVNANRRLALDILERNRGKWKAGKNGPEFSDSRLSEMYDYCLENILADTPASRWQRDFGMDKEVK